MSKAVYFRQCRLRKGDAHMTSWIPEKFAVVGKVVRLWENGAWDNGWVVDSAGEHRLDESMLPDWHRDIKGHRRATGDALPK
jgi:hypothetical protein